MYITAEERSHTGSHGLAGCQGHAFDTATCAWRVLEEIDYGLILVSPAGLLPLRWPVGLGVAVAHAMNRQDAHARPLPGREGPAPAR